MSKKNSASSSDHCPVEQSVARLQSISCIVYRQAKQHERFLQVLRNRARLLQHQLEITRRSLDETNVRLDQLEDFSFIQSNDLSLNQSK
mmetsp:Transcript_21577/g.32044  ORF Transcript_21577/g.32044 Transcript_21577/m.32044 type:complete len:89 (-) Transcript_21577:19-285(-)